MAEKKSKVDMKAMDRITIKVLAFRPSKHRKKIAKEKQGKHGSTPKGL